MACLMSPMKMMHAPAVQKSHTCKSTIVFIRWLIRKCDNSYTILYLVAVEPFSGVMTVVASFIGEA